MVRAAIANYSRNLEIVHEQMEAFGDPDSAELIGRVLDRGFVTFSELHTWIKTPADVRSLTRVAKARLVWETVDGLEAAPAAEEIARSILTVGEI